MYSPDDASKIMKGYRSEDRIISTTEHPDRKNYSVYYISDCHNSVSYGDTDDESKFPVYRFGDIKQKQIDWSKQCDFLLGYSNKEKADMLDSILIGCMDSGVLKKTDSGEYTCTIANVLDNPDICKHIAEAVIYGLKWNGFHTDNEKKEH
jgi:hypothetical protein